MWTDTVIAKARRITIVVSLALLVFTTIRLVNLSNNFQLWSWWPLLWYLSFGALILALWKGSLARIKERGDLLGLSILSGTCLGLGFMIPWLTPLFFIGFVPLLIVEHKISTTDYTYKKNRLTFHYAYISFCIYNIIATWWITNTHFMSGFLAIFLNAFLMTIPFILFRWTKKQFGEKLGYASLVIFWLAFEFLNHRWDLAYPWLTLGNGLGLTPFLIQWYELTGVLGGSLWILLSNLFIFYCIRDNNLKQKSGWTLQNLSKPLSYLLIPILFSLSFYLFRNVKEGQSVKVLVTQPNLEPHFGYYNLSKADRFQHYMNIVSGQLHDSLDYLVYPETSFNGIWLYSKVNNNNINSIEENFSIRRIRQLTNLYPQLHFVAGISSYQQFLSKEDYTPYTRIDEYMAYDAYNAAIQVTSKIDTIPHYVKSKLVPGAETIPFKEILGPIQGIVSNLGGVNGSLAKQKERTVFVNSKHKDVKVAPIICWESEFGEHITEFVKKGANVLFIMTNDGWWDNTTGHQQHFGFSIMRAIETRKYIARSANMGNSGFIDPMGRCLDKTKYGIQSNLEMSIPTVDGQTFYVKYGDYIGRFCLFLAIIIGCLLIKNKINPLAKR